MSAFQPRARSSTSSGSGIQLLQRATPLSHHPLRSSLPALPSHSSLSSSHRTSSVTSDPDDGLREWNQPREKPIPPHPIFVPQTTPFRFQELPEAIHAQSIVNAFIDHRYSAITEAADAPRFNWRTTIRDVTRIRGDGAHCDMSERARIHLDMGGEPVVLCDGAGVWVHGHAQHVSGSVLYLTVPGAESSGALLDIASGEMPSTRWEYRQTIYECRVSASNSSSSQTISAPLASLWRCFKVDRNGARMYASDSNPIGIHVLFLQGNAGERRRQRLGEHHFDAEDSEPVFAHGVTAPLQTLAKEILKALDMDNILPANR